MKAKQFKGTWLIALLVAVCLLTVGNPCFADEATLLGKEIREKAKKMKLDKINTGHGMKNGKSVKFTPAKLNHGMSVTDLEQGQVVGYLENELEGDETNLPPGKYHVYLKKVNGEWKGYAESSGKIAAEALRVTVEKRSGKQSGKPRFEPDGWCWCWLIGGSWWLCYCW